MKLKSLLIILTTATSLVGTVAPAMANQMTTLEQEREFYFDARGEQMCDDVALGNDTQNNSGSRHSSSSKTRSGGGGIGFKFLGIGGNINGRGSNSESESSGNQWDLGRRTLRTGTNCSTHSTNVTNLMMNRQNNETMRYGIDSQERMNQVNNDTQRYMFDGSMRNDFLNNMFR